MHGAVSCCSADAVSVKSSSDRMVQVMSGSCTSVAAGSPAALALPCLASHKEPQACRVYDGFHQYFRSQESVRAQVFTSLVPGGGSSRGSVPARASPLLSRPPFLALRYRRSTHSGSEIKMGAAPCSALLVKASFARPCGSRSNCNRYQDAASCSFATRRRTLSMVVWEPS